MVDMWRRGHRSCSRLAPSAQRVDRPRRAGLVAMAALATASQAQRMPTRARVLEVPCPVVSSSRTRPGSRRGGLRLGLTVLLLVTAACGGGTAPGHSAAPTTQSADLSTELRSRANGLLEVGATGAV